MSDDFDESLARARRHLTRATLEASEAVGAILEATGRASGLDAEQTEALARGLTRRFERQLERLREGQLLPAAIAGPLEDALAREIERWETRSRTDPDARAVLRAFLGLRELLWELGLRGAEAPGKEPSAAESPPGDPDASSPASSARSGASAAARPRVQRFEVEE